MPGLPALASDPGPSTRRTALSFSGGKNGGPSEPGRRQGVFQGRKATVLAWDLAPLPLLPPCITEKAADLFCMFSSQT